MYGDGGYFFLEPVTPSYGDIGYGYGVTARTSACKRKVSRAKKKMDKARKKKDKWCGKGKKKWCDKWTKNYRHRKAEYLAAKRACGRGKPKPVKRQPPPPSAAPGAPPPRACPPYHKRIRGKCRPIKKLPGTLASGQVAQAEAPAYMEDAYVSEQDYTQDYMQPGMAAQAAETFTQYAPDVDAAIATASDEAMELYDTGQEGGLEGIWDEYKMWIVLGGAGVAAWLLWPRKG